MFVLLCLKVVYVVIISTFQGTLQSVYNVYYIMYIIINVDITTSKNL